MHFILMISIFLFVFVDYILFRDRPLYPLPTEDENGGIGFRLGRKIGFYFTLLLE